MSNENSYVTKKQATDYINRLLGDPIEAEMFRRQYFGDFKPREKTKLVITQNRHQAREFCQWAGYDPKAMKRDEILVPVDARDLVEDLEGRTPNDLEIVVLGVPRWWNEQCEAYLEARGFELPHAALNIRDRQINTRRMTEW